MAKTFRDLTYSVLELATNFKITDDVEYPVIWVEDALISVHNTLMREAHQKRTLGDELLMLHENLPVKKIDSRIETDKFLINNSKSFCYAEIPSLVTQIDQIPLHYVGTTDLHTHYNYRSLHNLGDDRGVRWSLPTPSYTVYNNKILLEPKALSTAKYISVIAYFRDPRDVNTYDPDADFPTPSEYKLEMLTMQHLMVSKNMPADLINDAQRAIDMRGQKQTQDE